MSKVITELQDAIVSVREVEGLRFQENEIRPDAYGALTALNLGTSLLVPESTLQSIKEASRQTTSIDTFVKTADGVATARACEGTGDATTATTPLVYQTLAETFKVSEIECQGNRAKRVETIANQMRQKLRSLANRKNSALLTFLEAQAVAPAGTFGTTVANAQQFAAAVRLDYFNQMSTNLAENTFFGPYDNVHSFSQNELVRFDAAQGSQNGTNRGYQLGDYTNFQTTGITNGLNVQSTSYIFERGTAGVIDWVAPLYRNVTVHGDDTWFSMVDPFGRLGNVEVKTKTACVDNSATLGAGAEADLETSYVLSIEFAPLSAYDSTGTDSGIYKGEVMSV